ncbi:GntR family transcriptional regulator [Hydrogenophaga sp.]|uniref:GntR family transcriptional regulator n=1 Tax=Hydrogenophaga sp. TaxID=1904254 RepID=UPI0027292987|nr:GntR family transcriptional regulator [Hydrogenophaga sp.]MDO9435392.1 GntR family transcriptional regulator [Hydrogenophaga sp.]
MTRNADVSPPAAGTLLHRQLFLALREQIASGIYPPGSMIPKEDELCERFKVSRITVRRAVSDLQDLGILEKQQGRGTFVRNTTSLVRPAMSLSLMDSLNKAATETAVEVLTLERKPLPLAVATQLGLAVDEVAMHTVRLRKKDGKPVMVTEAWVLGQHGRKITRRDLQKKALFQILIGQGVKFGHAVQELTAVAATPTYAQLLNVAIGQPLLRLTRILFDQNKAPIERLMVYVSPERTRFLMAMDAENIDTSAAGHFSHDLG